MPTTNLGKVSLRPRGQYDPAAAYEALDVVSWQGGSYLALRAVQGVEPVGGEDYMVLTAKGDQGEKGDTVQQAYVVDTIAARDVLEKIPGLTVYVKDAAGQEKATPAKWTEFQNALADYWFNTRTPAAFEGLGDISVLNDELLLRKDGDGERFENWAEFSEIGAPGEIDTQFQDLLDKMSAYASSGATSDLNQITYATLSARGFKRTDSGLGISNKYQASMRTKLKALIEAAKSEPTEIYWDGANLKLTWYQIQYALNHSGLISTQYARSKDYTWAPEWTRRAYPASPIGIVLESISNAENAAVYIDATAKTISASWWQIQYLMADSGAKLTEILPTDQEIKREVKYPWMYVAGGDPTVSQGGALYLWDGAGWNKSGDMLANVYDPQGKREDVYAYADAAVQEVKDNPILVGGIPTVTTYTPEGGTDGVDYAADVPGVTEVYTSLTIRLLIHATSRSIRPELNVNGLGAKAMAKQGSTTTTQQPSSKTPNWLLGNRPVTLQFNGVAWTALGITTPYATDLAGMVATENGGTGLSTIPAGSYLVGNGTEPMQTKTAAEVALDIGKASVYEMYTPNGGELGVEYVADVPGLTELYEGLTLKIKVLDKSKSVEPTLNVNGLGAKKLCRYSPAHTTGSIAGGRADWLRARSIIQVLYNGENWIVMGVPSMPAYFLEGVANTKNGGTGLESPVAGKYLRTNGAEPMELVTPEELKADLGVIQLQEEISRLSDTVDNMMPPNDLTSLLRAAKKANNGDTAKLDLLTISDLYSQEYKMLQFRKTYLGAVKYEDTKTDLDELKRLIKLTVANEGTSLDWGQVQYCLFHGGSLGTSAQVVGEAKYYWWRFCNTAGPAAELDPQNASTLLEAAYQASVPVNPAAWDQLTAELAANAGNYHWESFRLIQSDTGDPVFSNLGFYQTADLDSLKAALIAMLADIQAAGDDYKTVTWHQVQYYLLSSPHKYLKADDPNLPDDAAYWWHKEKKDPNRIPKTAIDFFSELIPQITEFASFGIDSATLVETIPPEAWNTMGFYAADGSTPIAADGSNIYDVQNGFDMAVMMGDLFMMGASGTDARGNEVLSWYQVQDIIINGPKDMVPNAPSTAMSNMQTLGIHQPEWANALWPDGVTFTEAALTEEVPNDHT